METTTTARELPGGGIVDDSRSAADKARTVGYVVATDRFMSGWGKASGRSIFAVPVLEGQDAGVILDNMEHRTGMLRVRYIPGPVYRPRLYAGDHLSIREGDDGTCWTVPGYFAAQAARRRNAELAAR